MRGCEAITGELENSTTTISWSVVGITGEAALFFTHNSGPTHFGYYHVPAFPWWKHNGKHCTEAWLPLQSSLQVPVVEALNPSKLELRTRCLCFVFFLTGFVLR